MEGNDAPSQKPSSILSFDVLHLLKIDTSQPPFLPPQPHKDGVPWQ